MAMRNTTGIGAPVPRREDRRFLTGAGAFVDDIAWPGALVAHVLRADIAHGELDGLDTTAAAAMPGVRAILTGAELAGEGGAGLGGIACHTIQPIHRDVATRPAPPLATDRVRHVGQALALVVAESEAAARDAAEAIEVRARPLPSVVSVADALAPGAPAVWPDAPGNVAYRIALGDGPATEAALAGSDHVTRLRLHNTRIAASPLEPRAAAARWVPREERLEVHASTQAPHTARGQIAAALGLPAAAVHLLARDVGGGFGLKGGVHPEDLLVAWAALRLRAAVRWTASRSESLAADYHGRDQSVVAELGLDADGAITALRVRADTNAGAFLSPGGGVAPMFAATLATGCYRVPVADVETRAVYTHTSPTQPYRGAGRPEAAYVIERLMDAAARETGRDRAELRRLNAVRAAEMPYRTALVKTLDSGDFPGLLGRALAMADWDGAPARKAAARARGRLRGIGLALHMESAGLGDELAELRVDPGGGVTALVGTFSHGQGHETVYAQMVSDWLGVPPGAVRIVQGDTDALRFGRGTVASRSMMNGGGALRLATDAVIAHARAVAAHVLGAAVEEIEFADGLLVLAGSNRSLTLGQVAAAAQAPTLPDGLGAGLAAEAVCRLPGPAFPCGCQVAEVEVDPETGAVEVLGLWSVDDVGLALNPLLLDGQLVGGIAQGLGAALLERVVYDRGGQLLTGSFMDYAMPRARDIPPMAIALANTATANNPLGVKGAGEAGTVGATPAAISAVLDALAPLGVEDIAMPASPHAVWQAIEAARRARG